MIYWFTGQPGHGKTLHAIERLLEFKAQGRIVYACNVRGFDYEKTGVIPMTPEQFKDWPNFLPDGAVALVDEAYEHGMLPKRAPGSKVPHHVEELAKHRHRGLDFIFVSQSPDKQCDQFTHDLIERHVHVRRRFGTKFVHLREFDRFEANAEKAIPLVNRRKVLPKKIFGLYKSTELDTTERRIPWYYIAFFVGIPLAIFMMYYSFGRMGKHLGGEPKPVPTASTPATREVDGAQATATDSRKRVQTQAEYAESLKPRIPSQPWTAPIYDGKLSVSNEPPRIFCMLGSPGTNSAGQFRENSSCSCVTEQGTRYALPMKQCVTLAVDGQYEPFLDEKSNQRRVDGYAQQDMLRNDSRIRQEARSIDADGERARYGGFRGQQDEEPAYSGGGQ